MQLAHRIEHQESGGRPALPEAAPIPELSHPEAAEMSTVELERFLTLVEALALLIGTNPPPVPFGT
jgi:hypothetical protein